MRDDLVRDTLNRTLVGPDGGTGERFHHFTGSFGISDPFGIEIVGTVGHATIAFENQVPAGLEVDADPDQLFRVMVNLGRNAVQALDGGDQSPAVVRRLTMSGGRDGANVSIRVRDTGPGVPERARSHLFQAFQGGARPGGTGLGLAIAAEIVRAHGGTIALIDTAGPGATFEIVIPDRAGKNGRNGRNGGG